MHADRGYLLLDVRRLDDDGVDGVCRRIADIVDAAPAPAEDVLPPSRNDVLAASLKTWPDG